MLTMTGRPIGIAMLKCPQCGKIYTKQKECFSKKQATNWSSWMMRNYKGICPECYGKKA